MNSQHISKLFLLTVSAFLMVAISASCQSLEIETPSLSTSKIIEQGNNYLDEGKSLDAYNTFTKGLESSPRDVDLLLAAGKAASLAGYPDKTVQHLFDAVEVEPDSYVANLNLAIALRQQGQETAQDLMTQSEGYMMIEDSLKFFEKACSVNSRSPEPCMELANTYFSLYALEEADAAAIDALKRRPDLIDALLLRGDIAFVEYSNAATDGLDESELEKKWQNAMDLFFDASTRDRENPQAYLGMASLYGSLKKWDDAARAYRQALVRDTELLNGYNQLISIFSSDEVDTPLSACLLELLKSIEERYPGDVDKTATPLYYLGFAYFIESDFEESIKAYEKTKEINSQYEIASCYYIFRAAYELGDQDKAAELLLHAISKDPDSLTYYMQNDNDFMSKVFPAISYLAYHMVNKQKLDEALKINRHLLKVIDNDPSLYNNYGLLCRDTGKYEDSYTAYRKALEMDPSNPAYMNDTALILHYHLHRDLDKAEDLYQQAIVEAKKQIDDESINQVQLDIIKTALRDATNNLSRLKAGVIEEW